MNCTLMRTAGTTRTAVRPQAHRPRVVRPMVSFTPVVGAARTRTPILCSAGVSHPGEEAQKGESINNQFNPMMSVPGVFMAKGGGGGQNFGSGGSLGAVLERSKLEFVMPTPPIQAPKLDDGGSGGDIGKGIHNGGGGGDGDGGDDDDYFNEDGDGEGEGDGKGDNFFRTVIPESYDKFSIGAVFSEWMRSVAELPLILRRAVEMGLFSSAQLVRFFSMDVRPNVTRSLSRTLPPAWARDFVGRLMADPAFVQKMVLESSIAACASLWYEYRARGERFKDELDLVMINTLGMAAATGATCWLVSPSRSYGNVHKFPWQQMLEGLPNCVFDANGPLRQYSTQSRVGAFFTKAAELSAVGLLMGGATSLLSSAAVAARRKWLDPNFEPSVPVPEVAHSSAGLAAFFAVSANTRYQLIGGMDRYLMGHSNFLWTYLGLTGVARALSMQVGEMHRPWCQGLPEPSALPSARKRVVKRKVIVRRKVLRPVEQPMDLDAAAGTAGLVGAAAVASGSTGEVGAEPMMLDQVLAGPSGELHLPEELHLQQHQHQLAHQQPHHGEASSSSSGRGVSGQLVAQGAVHPIQMAESPDELRRLVEAQQSGALRQVLPEQLAHAAAAVGAGSGSVMHVQS